MQLPMWKMILVLFKKIIKSEVVLYLRRTPVALVQE